MRIESKPQSSKELISWDNSDDLPLQNMDLQLILIGNESSEETLEIGESTDQGFDFEWEWLYYAISPF